MSEVIEIDGSFGEGGGQMLRSALALSAVTGRPFRMTNIRAARPKPGLAAQHLECARAAAVVTSGRLEGAELRSTEIALRPGAARAGRYEFSIATAGSAPLLFQSLYLPLALAEGPSELLLGGGTHVEWSPSFDYLADVWSKAVREMGIGVDLELIDAGYYPKGGGRLKATLGGSTRLRPFVAERRPSRVHVTGRAVVTNLPDHIAERETTAARHTLGRRGVKPEIETAQVRGPAPGTFVHLECAGPGVYAGATALGRLGKRAEKVGHEAAGEVARFLKAGRAAVDAHLADQLVLPAALAGGESVYTTTEVTTHLTTHVELVRKFLDVTCELSERPDGSVEVRIAPGAADPR